MPLSSQAAASSSLIGREAFEMSVCPWQNTSKPPPVPEVPTDTLTPGCSPAKSSPAAAVSGWTVDEPSTRTSPDSESPPVASCSLLPPQADSPRAMTSAAGTAVRRTLRRVIDVVFTTAKLGSDRESTTERR
jgi:hypothetical protein